MNIMNPNTLEELIVEDPVLRLNGELNSSVKHRLGKTHVDTELDGEHLSRVYDYEGGSWGEQVASDQSYIMKLWMAIRERTPYVYYFQRASIRSLYPNWQRRTMKLSNDSPCPKTFHPMPKG
ncbi:hypothetical protein MNQ98_15295 [Paenibacillus sp. N3/727]|uniref:hypothetical protein n=1 Tax=Paenibacillus sp. N3/727 TaxID=2925845 RepID=UPI001F535036|nr:hypothetical protein [Paenibacillus sp. N3/727]UNK15922.1 hypothetical protein MNQ98_15295 [Paenibacillus sp. N3/727]